MNDQNAAIARWLAGIVGAVIAGVIVYHLTVGGKSTSQSQTVQTPLSLQPSPLISIPKLATTTTPIPTPTLIFTPESTPVSTPKPTPEETNIPPFSVWQTGPQEWAVTLPAGQWYDTGIPIMAGLYFEVRTLDSERDGKFFVGISDRMLWSVRSQDAYQTVGVWICDFYGCSPQVPSDFVDTIRLKVNDDSGFRALHLRVQIQDRDIPEPVAGDTVPREVRQRLRQQAWLKYKELLKKVSRR